MSLVHVSEEKKKKQKLIQKCLQNGKSPLLLASAAGHVTTCDILIGHGVDVNAADNVSRCMPNYFLFLFLG